MYEMEQLTFTEFGVKSSHWVNVTYIVDPLNFFVRQIKYSNFIECIEKTEPKDKQHTLNTSDLILFNMEWTKETTRFARGKIYFIGNTSDVNYYDIIALDYGNLVKDVPLCHIWKLSETYSNLPPLAIKCQLPFCIPKDGNQEFDQNAIDAFKYYVGNEKAKIIVESKTPEKLTVLMYNSAPDDMSTLLALTHYTKMGYIEPTVSKIHNDIKQKFVYTFRQYEVGQSVHVKVLCGDIYKTFHVVEVKDYETYSTELENFPNFASKGVPVGCLQYELTPGTPVFVKENEIFNRGIIMEVTVPFVIVNVLLVDAGRNCQVPVSNLRHMIKECIDMPPLSIFCRANENQAQFNSEYAEFVQPGKELLITFQKLGNKYNIPHTVYVSSMTRKI